MRIIITYASAGSGHRKAAESIYNYFKENCRTHEFRIIDALDKTNFLFRNIYTYGYAFLINRAAWLWRIGFWLTYVKWLRPINKILIFVINRLNAKNFADFLTQERPDFIISTHFFPSEISTYLKETCRINSKLINVITDFGVHPFWISKWIDLYVAASDFTKEQLILEGVTENKIKEFGIPVHHRFLMRYERGELCKKFEIAQNKFTVLITTGSFGIGPVEKIVDLLYKDVQMLVVCAHNKRLYLRLKNKNYTNVRIFGFIGYIQELMAVSDVMITKPGGLTISEGLVMELAPVFISPIPGQETENIKALKEYGIGEYPQCPEDIRKIVLDYKAHPDKLSRIKADIKAIKKPYALKDICDAVC